MDENVQRGGRQPFFTAQDVRNLHQMIVYLGGQMVGRVAVGLQENGVFEQPVLHRNLAVDRVGERCFAFHRHGEADRGVLPARGFVLGPLGVRDIPVPPVVAGREAALLLAFAHPGQFFGRVVSAVRFALGDELLHIPMVDV